jgi:hypothetical protein
MLARLGLFRSLEFLSGIGATPGVSCGIEWCDTQKDASRMGPRIAAVQYKYPMAQSELPLVFPMAAFQVKWSRGGTAPR